MKFLSIYLPSLVFLSSCSGLSELDEHVKSHAETITSKPISRSDLMTHFSLKEEGERMPSGVRGGKMTMSETWLLNSGHKLRAYKGYSGIITKVSEPKGVFRSPVNFEAKVYTTADYRPEKEFDGFYILGIKGNRIFPEE